MIEKSNASMNILNIENDYPDFGTFYTNNKEQIFRNIFDVYKYLRKTKKVEHNFIVKSKIEGDQIETHFLINIEDTDLLTNTILPYFEAIEDYETCAKIMKFLKKKN